MKSYFINTWGLILTCTFLFTHAGGLFAHGHHGEGGHQTAYREGYNAGYHHGWENHYEDHHWHHDHWHNNVYVVDPWYNPGFVYNDTAVAYPYYYNGYPYYYYHPNYYWGTGVNVNVNLGGY